MEQYASIKQITIKVDFYSVLILKATFTILHFMSVQLELVVHVNNSC